MTLDEFRRQIMATLPCGTELSNPGGGTSRIKSYSDHNITYVRRSSSITVKFEGLFSAYNSFRGKAVSSSDLRGYAPNIFDSKARPAGHSCNCTFFFMAAVALNLADRIEGEGKAGDPYKILLH